RTPCASWATTGSAELEDTVECIDRDKIHAYHFNPWHAEELLETLDRAARTFHRERYYEGLLEELPAINLQIERRVRDHKPGRANPRTPANDSRCPDRPPHWSPRSPRRRSARRG